MKDRLAELRDIVARHCSLRVQSTAVRGLSLMRSAESTTPNDAFCQPALCIAVQGRKRVVFGRDVFAYDSTSYLLATVDVPVRGCVVEATEDRPYLGLTFDLDPARITDLLLELPQTIASTGSPAGMVSGRLDDDLVDVITRLGRLLDHPQDAVILTPLIERELYYRLLLGEHGCAIRHIATSGTHVAAIAKAARWIRTHYSEPISVDALAGEAEMSVTSFHRHFKAITTVSPLQYRTQVRLHEARRMMLAEGLDAGSIGLTVGYESASQFSREYRKMFGAPPATDAARLRVAPSRESA